MITQNTYNLLLEKYKYEIDRVRKITQGLNPKSLLSWFNEKNKFPTTVLIIGDPATGKTGLLKELYAIGEENNIKGIWIDWREESIKYSHWLKPETRSVENYFSAIYSSVRDLGFGRYFKQYEEYSSTLKDAEKKLSDTIESMSSNKDTAPTFEKLRNFAASTIRGIVGSNLIGPAYNLVPDSLKESADAAIAETIKSLAISLAKARLNKKEYDVYLNGTERLLDALAKGLRSASERAPLLIILDQYELLLDSDSWIRYLIKKSGNYVVWAIACQISPNISLRDDYRNDIILSNGLIDIEITQLSIEEVENVVNRHPLKKREGTAGEIRKIYELTRGNIMALNMAMSLWHPGGNNAVDVLDPPSIRSKIVLPVFERYLYSALNEPADKIILSILAFCYNINNDLLKFLIGDNFEEKARKLSTSYPYLFEKSDQLTNTAKYWIREELLQSYNNNELSEVFEKALDWWSNKLNAYEAENPDIAWSVEQERWIELASGTAYHCFWSRGSSAYNILLRIIQKLLFAPRTTQTSFVDHLWHLTDRLHDENKELINLLNHYQYGILRIAFTHNLPIESNQIIYSQTRIMDNKGNVVADIGPRVTKDALDLFEKELSDESINAIATKVLQSYYQVQSGNFESALALLDLGKSRLNIENISKTKEYVGNAYLTLGRTLMSSNRASGVALTSLLRAKELLSETPTMLTDIATTHYKLCRYQDAISYANKAIELDPTSGSAYNTKASAVDIVEGHASALVVYQDGLKQEKQPYVRSVLLTNLGITYMNIGNFSEAEKYFDEALLIKSDSSSTLIAKSLLEHRKNPESALLNLRKSIEFVYWLDDYYVNSILSILRMTNDQNALDILNNIPNGAVATRSAAARLAYEHAMLLNKLNHKPDALARLNNAIAIDPKFVPAYLAAAQICTDLNKLRDARGYALQALETNFGGVTRYFRTNLIASTLKQITAKQVKGIDRGLTKSQKHGAEAFILKGISDLLLGKYNNAAHNLRFALRHSSDDFFIHLFLGQIEAMRGDLMAAVKDTESAIVRLEDGHKGFAYYQLAIIKREQGLLEEAVLLYKKAISDFGLNYFKNFSIVSYIYFDLALCQFKIGDNDSAQISLEKTYSIDPFDWPGRVSKIILLMKSDTNEGRQEASFEVKRLERDLEWDYQIEKLKSNDFRSKELEDVFKGSIIVGVVRPLLMGALIAGDEYTVNKIIDGIKSLDDIGLDILYSLELENPIFKLSPADLTKNLLEIKEGIPKKDEQEDKIDRDITLLDSDGNDLI